MPEIACQLPFAFRFDLSTGYLQKSQKGLRNGNTKLSYARDQLAGLVLPVPSCPHSLLFSGLPRTPAPESEQPFHPLMNSSVPPAPSISTGRAGGFPHTHWSVVMAAAQSDSPKSEDALAELCSGYWYPLYAFIRRCGHAPHAAEDLTQEFFAALLNKRYLAGIKVEGGRFRSYLLTVLKHFLANDRQKQLAQKRGGKHIFVSLDLDKAEDRYQYEPTAKETPETLFEQRWASTLLNQVLAALESEYRANDRLDLFESLRGFLSGDTAQIPYAELAARLGLSQGAVKVAVHRLRKRYGQLLRGAIARTVGSPEEVDDEIRYLIGLLG